MYFWDKHKTITSYYELLSSRICDQYGLTQMEYDILMFLHNNPQHNTAAEIVKIRKSTKSHVSTSLKKLENKGFIERIQSEDNKKHIEIVLLDKAELIVEAGINVQKQFAQNVLSGLTEEETHMCIKVFNKICNNAEEYLRKYKERNERE
ncbi:MarR family winged helix-turn-helix transcriptional regulator [Blautia ammoniilytica]|uniref:MarR family transcriptional regulator n=1 Tax=Blautia ammoniilytica TaxID=2981782 RepID=A0ABT2TSX4_9FIRM|nr:MarR family transcriptional regulator [Blautia ammoniilytica]MCU6765343.1 MarR family transcriptional regulator [Blautia ammoniilytica]SCH99101.1 transcriptional regulator SlyA [uncultured Blautia sp.]